MFKLIKHFWVLFLACAVSSSSQVAAEYREMGHMDRVRIFYDILTRAQQQVQENEFSIQLILFENGSYSCISGTNLRARLESGTLAQNTVVAYITEEEQIMLNIANDFLNSTNVTPLVQYDRNTNQIKFLKNRPEGDTNFEWIQIAFEKAKLLLSATANELTPKENIERQELLPTINPSAIHAFCSAIAYQPSFQFLYQDLFNETSIAIEDRVEANQAE